MKMKRWGFALMLAAPIPLIGSCLLFGLISSRADDANRVLILPLKVNETAKTNVTKVSTERYCQIAVELMVHSEATKTYKTSDFETGKKREKYVLQYRFPFEYEVVDAAGSTLYTDTTEIAWDHRSRSSSHAVPAGSGGAVLMTHKFETFRVADPGEIQVSVKVEPDREFEATIESANVIVYDNVPDDDVTLFATIVVFGAAPALFLAGVILLVAGNSYLKPLPQQLGQSSAIRQVPTVGALMILLGILEAFSALPVLLFGSLVTSFFSGIWSPSDNARQSTDPSAALIFNIPLLFGILCMTPPILRVSAGFLNMRYRGRILGMVALVPGLVTLGTCFGVLTGPFAVGLLAYGMIVYLNRDVVQAFKLRRDGYSVDQIKSMPGASDHPVDAVALGR
jgi:hypothetical protein